MAARPAEALDCIRAQGWIGVLGNTDEMLFTPDALTDFARASRTELQPMFQAIEEMASFTRAALGHERIAWLRSLAPAHIHASFALVHASPGDLWCAPGADAADADFARAYRSLHHAQVVYGHIHHPFVRRVGEMTVANTGSVGMPFDGDPRASYLLLDETGPQIRRVAYDLNRELSAVRASGMPHADWVLRTLQTARPQMP